MVKTFLENDFNKIYDIMKKSFPTSEIRSFKGQKELLKDDRYTIYCSYDEDKVIGVLCVWSLNGFFFLEHFAVHPDYRNKGVGTKLIKEVCEKLNGFVFLEVEPPETLIQKRRVDFYKRLGFFINDYEYFQPSFGKDLPAVPLKIMTYGKEVNMDEFLKIKEVVYREVYHQ